MGITKFEHHLQDRRNFKPKAEGVETLRMKWEPCVLEIRPATLPGIEGFEALDRIGLKESRSLTSITKYWKNWVVDAYFAEMI
jgi:hypothetical protein